MGMENYLVDLAIFSRLKEQMTINGANKELRNRGWEELSVRCIVCLKIESVILGSNRENIIRLNLVTSFGIVALTLAFIGLYGVVSFMVGRRTQEIGIRMALGAQKSNVLGLILTNGISLAAIGLVLGLVGSFAVTPLLGSVLVGVSPRDPGTFVTIALVLIAATAVASWIPANRATHVDPMVALRYE